jgi:hypothetical protein
MKKTLVEKHFDKVAKDYDSGKRKYSYYYESLKRLLGSLIPKGDQMIAISKTKYRNAKNLEFSTVWPTDYFDYIFMSDVVEHLEDPLEIFKKISKLINERSKFIVTMANPTWEPLLMVWEKLGLKMLEGPHKRVAFEDLEFMIQESGMRISKHDYRLLVPVEVPFVTNFANKHLEKPFKRLAFIEYLVVVKD